MVVQLVRLTTKVGSNLHDLVTRLDDLRIQLERSLGGDQIDQFLHWFDVGGFQGSLRENANTRDFPDYRGSQRPRRPWLDRDYHPTLLVRRD